MKEILTILASVLMLAGIGNEVMGSVDVRVDQEVPLQNKSGNQSPDLNESLESGLGTVITSDGDQRAVKKLLLQYKSAIQNLDIDETQGLFLDDSFIIESGKVEGTYKEYLEHHLLPELELFESFVFWDYKLDVEIQDLHAYAFETYNYRIVLKDSKKVINRKGVTTTVLVKRNDEWKIYMSHMSSLNP